MEERNPNHPGELSTDAAVAEKQRPSEELNARRDAIVTLQNAGVPFLVGGMYAFAAHTGIYRDTKDLDLHVMKEDAPRAMRVLEQAGWRTERRDELWLYKAFQGDYFVDFIFCSGNGITCVDEDWFRYAYPTTVFGRPCLAAPAEEQIWSKAFVNERERFDGADVNHLLLKAGPRLDWVRLLRRFDRHWELLFAHLMMFRFAYPSERDIIPEWVMTELLAKTARTIADGCSPDRVCRGTLLSRAMYTVDVDEWRFADGRVFDREDPVREGEGHPEVEALPVQTG